MVYNDRNLRNWIKLLVVGIYFTSHELEIYRYFGKRKKKFDLIEFKLQIILEMITFPFSTQTFRII